MSEKYMFSGKESTKERRKKPIVLTVAGFDPSSGAGIGADLKTFENIGVYGYAVCTAITYQNAEEVYGWKPLPAEDVKKQMDALFDKYEIKYVKLGMQGSVDTLRIIKEFQREYGFELVTDPIIRSGGGTELNDERVREFIMKEIFPISSTVIFNREEAEYYSGKKITDMYSVQEISEVLADMGIKNVIITGGHIDEESDMVMDYLFTDSYFRFYPRKRVMTGSKRVHGTGCVFSSLVTGFLAHGFDIEEALLFSEDFMEETFEKLFPIKNSYVLDTGYTLEEIDVLKAVQKVVRFIEGNKDFVPLIPEVRTNVAICKPGATTLKDVAAVDGRITVVSGVPVAAGPIRFGAANHTARLLLAAKRYSDEINAVINLKYRPEYIMKAAGKSGLTIATVDRSEQGELGTKENTTMAWIVDRVYMKYKKIPDIIWDAGEPEKEPMIRLFGTDADDLIKKLKTFINVIGE